MRKRFYQKLKQCGAILMSAAMLTTSLPVTAAASVSSATGAGTFTNPVIYADVPDVDVIRVGDTYYMSSTTMHMSPGVPILKSKDLVNWETVNYVYDTLTTNDAMSLRNDQSAYGKGSWASSLRYHAGNYYVSFASYTTGKTYIYKTADIENGPWTHTELDGVYHDQGLFFDDDGSIYMLWGSGSVKAIELEETEEGLQLKEGAEEQTLIADVWAGTELSGDNTFLYGEGTHIQKINGKYYIFMISWPPVNEAAGTKGMRTELCFRADTLTGDYERKIILADDGAAQGGIVDTEDGDWYGMVFRDNGSVGRTPVLVPVTWENGWPMMGEDGKVPSEMEIPVQGMEESGIVVSDEFYNNADRKVYTPEQEAQANGSAAAAAYEERAAAQEELISEEIAAADEAANAETEEITEENAGEEEDGYELLLNGGFEDGLDNWITNDGAQIQLETEEVYNGSNSILVTNRSLTGSGPRQDITGQVSHGGVYKVSAKVKYTTGPAQRNFNICIYNGTSYIDSRSIEIMGSGTIKKGEWGTISGTYTLQSDRDISATAIFVETSWVQSPSAENDLMDFYVDDVSVQEVSVPDGLDGNLLVNGGFEKNTDAWTGKNGTSLTLTTEEKTGGRTSVCVSGRTATGDGPEQDIAGKVEPGDKLEISVNVKYTTGPDTRQFYVTAQYPGSYVFKNMAGAVLKKGEWGTITGTYTVPEDQDLSSMKVFVETGWTAEQDPDNDLMDFYVDDFLIKLKPADSIAVGENDYNGSNLNLAWQWNHNPDNNNWSLNERPGYLRLTTGRTSSGLLDAKNTLTQRTYGPTCSGSIAMDVSNMKNGDVAGLAALQAKYGYVGVKMSEGSKYIVMVITDSDESVEREVVSIPLNQNTVYFRTDYDFTNRTDKADFYYSLDGSNWAKIGEQLQMTYSLKHFMGYRFAIFNYATRSVGGFVDVDYFRVEDQASDAASATLTAGLGDAQQVLGVENTELEVPVTLDTLEGTCSKLEASICIPDGLTVTDVVFNVPGEASYTYKGGQLKLKVTGNDMSFTDRTLATIELKVSDYVSADTTVTLKADYVKISGQDVTVDVSEAKTDVTLTYLDMGAVAKKPGYSNPLMDYEFGADPYALVYDGRVYIYMTNDSQQYAANNNGETDNGYGAINTINVISSADMVNWTDHGSIPVAGKNNPEGAAKWANNSWAPAVAHKVIDGEDKFFLYFADNGSGIGVLVADSPIGPFTDPLGKQLISWGMQASEGVTWLFDPAVLVDDDGNGYLYYGGGVPDGKANNPMTVRVVKLGDDMISLDGEAKVIDAPAVFEDSGIHKYNGIYYYSYCSNFSPHSDGYPGQGNICYMTSDSPMGPFTYQGEILKNMAGFFGVGGNNHHAMFEFNGKTYITYHAQTLGKAIGNTKGYRSTHINEVSYYSDGRIKDITADYEGISQLQTIDPYTAHEAETIAWQKGITMDACSEPGLMVDVLNRKVAGIEDGDWTAVSDIDFGDAGAESFTIKAAGLAGGSIDLYLDSIQGEKIGTVEIPSGDDGSFREYSCEIAEATGVHSVFMVYSGEADAQLFELDNWSFTEKEIVVPTVTPTPEPTVTNTPEPTKTPKPTGTPGQHVSHVGKTFVVNGLKYKVTKDNEKNREVRVTSLKTNKKTLKIPATVTNSSWKETFKVTSVKAKAFKGKNITKAVIGKNVTKIGPNAFLNCKKLKSVTIGKNVKNIGIRAFYGCSKLTKVTINSKVLKTVKKNAFKRISKKAVIKVPAGKKKAYTKKLKGKIAKGVKIK